MTGTAMAKRPKGGEKDEGSKEDRSNRKSAPIQVEKDLARMAAVVASFRGITQSELCSPALRPFLTTQYRLVQAEMGKEIEGGGAG